MQAAPPVCHSQRAAAPCCDTGTRACCALQAAYRTPEKRVFLRFFSHASHRAGRALSTGSMVPAGPSAPREREPADPGGGERGLCGGGSRGRGQGHGGLPPPPAAGGAQQVDSPLAGGNETRKTGGQRCRSPVVSKLREDWELCCILVNRMGLAHGQAKDSLPRLVEGPPRTQRHRCTFLPLPVRSSSIKRRLEGRQHSVS